VELKRRYKRSSDICLGCSEVIPPVAVGAFTVEGILPIAAIKAITGLVLFPGRIQVVPTQVRRYLLAL
jgi:hypothetical protein